MMGLQNVGTIEKKILQEVYSSKKPKKYLSDPQVPIVRRALDILPSLFEINQSELCQSI